MDAFIDSADEVIFAKVQHDCLVDYVGCLGV